MERRLEYMRSRSESKRERREEEEELRRRWRDQPGGQWAEVRGSGDDILGGVARGGGGRLVDGLRWGVGARVTW